MTTFGWWIWNIGWKLWKCIWIDSRSLNWWSGSYCFMYVNPGKIIIRWSILTQVILDALVKYSLSFTTAEMMDKDLILSAQNKDPNTIINIKSYGISRWSELDLLMQFIYCMNSSEQLFLICLKKFKEQLVTALPSLIHFLGSFNSVLHNTNSYKR